MRRFFSWLLFVGLVAAGSHLHAQQSGITPEQIYQREIEWAHLIGTWEVLPEENPLAENSKSNATPSHRTLMTLRKDGTCRVFNKDHRTGSDAIWTFENHEMFITFPNGSRIEYFVYGVKKDFMITRSPIKDGRDQLWSRIK